MLRKHKKLTKKELKHDPLVIFAAQVVDFLQNEWLKIVATIAIVLVVILGMTFFIGSRGRSAINAYDAAITAMNNNAPEAMDLLKHVADDYGSSEQGKEALLMLANSYLLQKNYDEAETYYKEFIDSAHADQVHLFNAYNALGGIYEEKGDYQKAAETYEQFLKKSSTSVFASVMYLNAGKSYYHSGNLGAAKTNFEKITESYKDSEENQEAVYFLELIDATESMN